MPKKRTDNEISPEALARRIAELSFTKKATDVTVMDLRGVTSMTDFFVICSGETDKQVKAISEAVIEGLRDESVRPWHREGIENATWVLIDYVDVVVHIFQEKIRGHFNLEQLWGDAKIEKIEDRPQQ